jgi:hypothetical protein
MGKRLYFPTRAFGSDGGLPDATTLSGWVSGRRGREGDLFSFLLEQELSYQVTAGISNPCAGGKFYFDRWQNALTGTEGNRVIGELGYDPVSIVRDAEDMSMMVRGVWMTIPAPHVLSLKNQYFNDPDDASQEIYTVYRDMMRSGRDVHLGGHILYCEQFLKDELEALAGRKAFFFSPEMNRKSLSQCLEFQQNVALKPEMLPVLQELLAEYEVHRIILLDPDQDGIRQVLSIRDPDQITCGGYCPADCREYWKVLVKKSSILT